MFTLIFECTKMINLKPLEMMVNLFLEQTVSSVNCKNHVNWMPIVKQYAHKSKPNHKMFSFLHLRSQISVHNSLLFQIPTIFLSPIFKYVLIYIIVKIMLLCSFVACDFFVNLPFWLLHFIPSAAAPILLTLNSTQEVLNSYTVDLQHLQRIRHLHMGKLFFPTYGRREKKPKWTSLTTPFISQSQDRTMGSLMYESLCTSHTCNHNVV